MIMPEYARTMAAHSTEVNKRVYGVARRLPDAKRPVDGRVF